MRGPWLRRTEVGVGLILLSLAVLGLVFGFNLSATRIVRADDQAKQAAEAPPSPGDESARQVTVFAILATPDSNTVDPRLASVKLQLRKVLPNHGFKLIDVQSKRVVQDQAVTCELGKGYKAETVLVRSLDENGKVQLRCELSLNHKRQSSTLVKTPVNQLFFYERSLEDGSRVLIGIGAR